MILEVLRDILSSITWFTFTVLLTYEANYLTDAIGDIDHSNFSFYLAECTPLLFCLALLILILISISISISMFGFYEQFFFFCNFVFSFICLGFFFIEQKKQRANAEFTTLTSEVTRHVTEIKIVPFSYNRNLKPRVPVWGFGLSLSKPRWYALRYHEQQPPSPPAPPPSSALPYSLDLRRPDSSTMGLTPTQLLFRWSTTPSLSPGLRNQVPFQLCSSIPYCFLHKVSNSVWFWLNADESYGQAQLVLEQCLSSQTNEGHDLGTHNSRAMVLMAMSTLLSERLYLLFSLCFW